MGTEGMLAAALVAAAALGALELKAWWHPVTAPAALRRRLHPTPAPPRWRPPPAAWHAPLVGMGSGGAVLLLTGITGFGLAIGAISWAVAAYALPRWRRRRFREAVRAELLVALGQLAVALRAGQSLATALQEWPGSLFRGLGNPGRVLMPHVEKVRHDLACGATPEEALDALAKRLQLDEVGTLAQAIRLGRRQGVNLAQVVGEAAGMLAETLELRLQVQAMTAGKRTEGLVLLLLPPITLLLLALEAPAFVLPLVQTQAGRFLLAIALLMQAASFILGRWVLDAEV